ncbi:MAG TPA: hypothetical protein VHE61_09680 [Opitutaceae bacterium]|nr:hypothetical protein [Opitutaceae bacterium]
MNENPAAKLTKEEKDAAFEKAFEGLTPAEGAHLLLVEKLESFRAQIVERRVHGYSWLQIAEALKRLDPPLATTPYALRKMFAGRTRRAHRSLAKHAAVAAKTAEGAAKVSAEPASVAKARG